MGSYMVSSYNILISSCLCMYVHIYAYLIILYIKIASSYFETFLVSKALINLKLYHEEQGLLCSCKDILLCANV